MSKKRVHEIAKELKDQGVELDNKEVVTELVALGYDVKSHSSSLEDDQATAAVQKILDKRKPKQAAAPVAAKGFVVRRKAPTAPSASDAGYEEAPAETPRAAEASAAEAPAADTPRAVEAPAEAPRAAAAPPPAAAAPEVSAAAAAPPAPAPEAPRAAAPVSETPAAPVASATPAEAPRAEAQPAAAEPSSPATQPSSPAAAIEAPRAAEPPRAVTPPPAAAAQPSSPVKESPSLSTRPPSAVPPTVRTPSAHPSSGPHRTSSPGGPGGMGARPGGPGGQGGRPGGPGGQGGRPGGPGGQGGRPGGSGGQYQRGAPSQYQRSGGIQSTGPVRPSSPGGTAGGAPGAAPGQPGQQVMVGGVPHQQVTQDARSLRPTATQAVVISRPLIQVRRVTPTGGAGKQYPMAPGKSAIGTEKREFRVIPDHAGRGRELVDVSKGKDKEKAGRTKRGPAGEGGPSKQEISDLVWGRVTIPIRGKKKKPTKKGAKTQITQMAEEKKVIKIQEGISVSDLGQRMGVRTNELIKKLMGLGKMATANQIIDPETTELLATDYG
ncbi:MAG TPA: translation initiation factor IF-2 N-terminal domain-containing protein, partial [Archangium sp.]|nr:translation initiation factor IF-2 N-terminal domain-containing protein [Archangium sp.]